jgi:FtsH-binding integral membrane protein
MAQYKTAPTRRTENQISPSTIFSIIATISAVMTLLLSLYALIQHQKVKNQDQAKIMLDVSLLIGGLGLIFFGIWRGAKPQQPAE